jgi:hypothetical protein
MAASKKGTLIWSILGAVGVVGAVLCWLSMSEYRNAKAWPTTEATITESEVRTVHLQRDEGQPSERAVIRFVYTVEGKEHSSGRINRAFAGEQSLVEKYPVGTKIVINYDPFDPDNGWFDAAGHSRWYPGLGVSLLLTILGGVMLVRGLMKK